MRRPSSVAAIGKAEGCWYLMPWGEIAEVPDIADLEGEDGAIRIPTTGEDVVITRVQFK